mgnify:CR=1 FL=1
MMPVAGAMSSSPFCARMSMPRCPAIHAWYGPSNRATISLPCTGITMPAVHAVRPHRPSRIGTRMRDGAYCAHPQHRHRKDETMTPKSRAEHIARIRRRRRLIRAGIAHREGMMRRAAAFARKRRSAFVGSAPAARATLDLLTPCATAFSARRSTSESATCRSCSATPTVVVRGPWWLLFVVPDAGCASMRAPQAQETCSSMDSAWSCSSAFLSMPLALIRTSFPHRPHTWRDDDTAGARHIA